MYFLIVIATTIVLPIGSAMVETWLYFQELFNQQVWIVPGLPEVAITFLGKWYVFWAGGVRLFLAGLRQTIRPGQTLTDIFEIDHPPAGQIVRELGFANLSTGLLCMLSLLIPILSPAGAITAGVFYGLAGIAHATSRKTHEEFWTVRADLAPGETGTFTKRPERPLKHGSEHYYHFAYGAKFVVLN